MRGGQLSEERMLSKGISKLIRANCGNTLPEKVSRATQPRFKIFWISGLPKVPSEPNRVC
jgi:hypothetical protein